MEAGVRFPAEPMHVDVLADSASQESFGGNPRVDALGSHFSEETSGMGDEEGKETKGTGAQNSVGRGLHRRRPAEDAARERPAPKPAMKRKEFDREMKRLQVELVKLQEWVRASGTKICVLFEGRDAAGKGGVIKRITERTSPRVFRVVALSAPTDREKSQMYFQRYIPHLPAAGEVVLFDRSWYNRAGVERVMGFTEPEGVDRFLRLTPVVEQAIIDSGVILVKYWLEVNMENQTKRFEERITDQRKTWKLSPMDLESHRRWYDYSRARDAMFAATDTDASPWYVVDANDQRRGRLNCIAHFLSLVPYHEVPRETVTLPARQAAQGYTEPEHEFRYVPDRY
jgi:polyphosphate kinase 2